MGGAITVNPNMVLPNILNYWEENPDHYPDVVATSCWYGEPVHYYDDSWLLDWLENRYATSVIDGTYYRFYYK